MEKNILASHEQDVHGDLSQLWGNNYDVVKNHDPILLFLLSSFPHSCIQDFKGGNNVIFWALALTFHV